MINERNNKQISSVSLILNSSSKKKKFLANVVVLFLSKLVKNVSHSLINYENVL